MPMHQRILTSLHQNAPL